MQSLHFSKKSIFLLYILLIPLWFSCSHKSAFTLDIPDFYPSEVLESSSGGVRYFAFTADQKGAISNFFEKNGDASLLIQISPLKIRTSAVDTEGILSFGFFYDFASRKSEIQSLPVITDFLKKYEGSSFALSFCFSSEKGCPAGFFIKSASKVRIDSAQILRAFVGHDFSGEIPVYAFAPNGGTNNGTDDFRGASLAFNSINSREGLMPRITVKFSDTKGRQKLAFDGEVLYIRRTSEPVEIPTAALKSPFSVVTYPDEESYPLSVLLTASDKNLLTFAQGKKNVLVPIKVDPGLIMKWSRNNWRGNDYELFEWDRFPGVLFFDISTYSVQDDFFRRLAFFVEKAGYKGRLLSDSELKGKHGYNAHDYKADDLARFFEKARLENFPLNDKELLLKEILAYNGVIKISSNGEVTAGQGAAISISQESPTYLRTTFIAHEGWHGIFFIDEEFRNTVASIYYTIDPKTLAYLRKYFQVTPTLNYDVRDDYLMKNEFMAYLLQQPVSSTATYFVNMAKREHSQQMAKYEADYIIETAGSGFESAASLLDEYVSDRWNLNAGRVWLITR
ncbi:MAG: hypothetical protein IJ530_07550 [Treponema sp.]|uniref:hypothetical protein n=1 Tax=Treponema sp. TaxID=166 RepID=UPI0025D2EBA0|nr:hypothetical protein [Treponema sp.]MBQ8679603.1 hypothetical protein [Treponema sp.]